MRPAPRRGSFLLVAAAGLSVCAANLPAQLEPAAPEPLAAQQLDVAALVEQAMTDHAGHGDAPLRTVVLSASDAPPPPKPPALATLGAPNQFRYLVDVRNQADNDGNGTSEDDFESGFQTRRTRPWIMGSVLDPRLSFRINAAFQRSGGDVVLEDAYIAFKAGAGWVVTAGQFKPPLSREELVSSSVQLAVEQSFATAAFLNNWSQGIMLVHTGEHTRLSLAFTDGVQSANSDFDSTRRASSQGLLTQANSGEADYALSGRFEWQTSTAWERFRDFTSPAGSPTAALLGVAGHIEGADRADPDFSQAGYLYAQWHADISIEGDGWNALLAAVGGHMSAEPPAGGLPDHRDDFGFTAHAGAYIPGTQWEPYVQYSLLLPDPDRTGDDLRAFNVLAIGVNYYLHGHAAKFTGDIVWFANDQNALTGPRTTFGYLGDDDPNELLLRLQWQLLF